jgi:hypothetical protein
VYNYKYTIYSYLWMFHAPKYDEFSQENPPWIQSIPPRVSGGVSMSLLAILEHKSQTRLRLCGLIIRPWQRASRLRQISWFPVISSFQNFWHVFKWAVSEPPPWLIPVRLGGDYHNPLREILPAKPGFFGTTFEVLKIFERSSGDRFPPARPKSQARKYRAGHWLRI